MDLRQLEYLIAVDDHGSFTRAARAVHVSQPSLSHGIRTLEAELGVALFARVGRNVVVTEAGVRIMDAARCVVREMSDLRAAAAAVTSLSTGRLDIVALATLAVDPLASLIGEFRIAFPGIVVRVIEPEEAPDVAEIVRSGRAEVGLCDLAGPVRGLRRIELGRQEIVAVSPPGGRRSRQGLEDPLTVRALAELPLVVTPAGTSTRRLLERMLSRSDLEPNVVVEVNSREAIVPLVLAGAGTSLLPRPLAEEAAVRGAVVRSLRPGLFRRIGLLHRSAPLSPAANAMVQLAIANRDAPAGRAKAQARLGKR